MPLPFKFEYDWKNPDTVAVWQWRAEKLAKIRADPTCLPHLKCYYADHIGDFISAWGCTVDPRNADMGLPAVMPFVLFPAQEDWVGWFLECWKARENGITDKSRDMGMSWLVVAVACALCLFVPGFTAGFGSRKEEYVDRIGDPKSLFWKAREFLSFLPVEFRGGWERDRHAPHMRIMFPETGNIMTGEAGDNIGRGDRTSVYFVDESAHLEHPELIEASLSATTNCRIDLSSVNGTDNPFARKLIEGKVRRKTMHWLMDPRKNYEGSTWYAEQQEKLDSVTLAQEVDIDLNASTKGVLIPSAWIQSAIDAHTKLRITPTGLRAGALDVADEGADLNAFCGTHGILIERVEEWSGKGADIFGTVQQAFLLCDINQYARFRYDSDGLGAGVRGDARIINDGRTVKIETEAFRGSESVINPDKFVEDTNRTNKDFFANRKAQAWWALRARFRNTYRWIVEGIACGPDDIISISPSCTNRIKLVMELAQPTYSINTVGKIIVNKIPEGSRSPNLADAVMMSFADAGFKPMVISDTVLAQFGRRY